MAIEHWASVDPLALLEHLVDAVRVLDQLRGHTLYEVSQQLLRPR